MANKGKLDKLLGELEKQKNELTELIQRFEEAGEDVTIESGQLMAIEDTIEYVNNLKNTEYMETEQDIKAKLYRNYRESCGVDSPTMLDEIEEAYFQGMRAQEKEMINGAVDTIVVNDWTYGKDPDHAVIPAIHQRLDGLTVGNKVKLIIIKEKLKWEE